MSKALDMADLIKARLNAAPAAGELATPVDITGVEVIIYRQQDLGSKIAAASAKASGTAIVILWDGYVFPDAAARTPRISNSYTIEVWSKPVIANAELPADGVMEAIVRRLWHWVPVGFSHLDECVLTGGGLVPDSKFLKYDLSLTIPVSL